MVNTEPQVKGAGCLSQQLHCLCPEFLPAWPGMLVTSRYCNSDLAAAQNCAHTSSPLLVQNPSELPCSRVSGGASPSSDPALPLYLPGLDCSLNLAVIPHCLSLQNKLPGEHHTSTYSEKEKQMIVFLELLFQDALWPFCLTSLIKNAYVVQEIWLVSMSGLLNC